jgi:hypothetical protein
VRWALALGVLLGLLSGCTGDCIRKCNEQLNTCVKANKRDLDCQELVMSCNQACNQSGTWVLRSDDRSD